MVRFPNGNGCRFSRAAGATVIDFRGAEIEQLHGIHHEMNDVVGWHPVTQIRGATASGCHDPQRQNELSCAE